MIWGVHTILITTDSIIGHSLDKEWVIRIFFYFPGFKASYAPQLVRPPEARSVGHLLALHQAVQWFHRSEFQDDLHRQSTSISCIFWVATVYARYLPKADLRVHGHARYALHRIFPPAPPTPITRIRGDKLLLCDGIFR